MGVLQRFERRLEDVVEGAFARVFGGAVQPAEVAAALQREGEQRKAIVAAGRTLVPNDYVVELSSSDTERLGAYDVPLRRELAAMVTEHAVEQGWSFVGPVGVRFEHVGELRTGLFRVRSAVLATEPAPAAARTGPLLLLADQRLTLSPGLTVIGRGAEADVRLLDAGVSRRHVELHHEADGSVVLLDAGSTNGTLVNGRPAQRTRLADGDQVRVGGTTLTFLADAPAAADEPAVDDPSRSGS